ncbi:MAG: ParB/RepB/Spo0J family partition protein [Deinococcota bacterium]
MTRRRPERRGDLAGLLGRAQDLTQPAETDTRRVALSELRPHGGQPRRYFTPSDLEALTQSVRERGILQPLLVRPAPDGSGYEIAAGERRYRAALAAGLPDVPVLIRPLSDEQMLEVGLVENLQRENLNPLDEVEGTLRLLALRLNVTPEEARQKMMAALRRPVEAELQIFEQVFTLLGRESWESFAKNKLRVLHWPPEVLEAMRERGLAYSLAAVVAAAPAEHRARLLQEALGGATRQQLRETLAALKPVAGSPQVNMREVQRLGRTLGNSKWLQALSVQQQTELDRWLRKMPEWMREAQAKR